MSSDIEIPECIRINLNNRLDKHWRMSRKCSDERNDTNATEHVDSATGENSTNLPPDPSNKNQNSQLISPPYAFRGSKISCAARDSDSI